MAGQLIRRGASTWLVRIYLGRDSNGRRKFHNHTVHGSKKDADRYRTRILRERDLGTLAEPSRQTVSEYLPRWVVEVAKPRVRERTFADYVSHIERYILPSLGAYRLSSLTPSLIHSFYASMREKGLSPRTIRYVHSTLRSSLGQAVTWGQLSRNPADFVDLPKMERREMRVWTQQETMAFLEAAKETRWYALWALLLGTGMRPSEALALRWSDFDGERVRIQRTLSRVGSSWRFEEPKTSRSRRAVPLPPHLAAILRSHRRTQASERLRAGPTYRDQDLVFATKTGEPLEHRLLSQRYFRPLAAAAKVPVIRPYDMRHTHATLLLGAGVNPKVVSERLGHSSIVLTLDVYSHVLSDMQQAAADEVNRLLFAGSATA